MAVIVDIGVEINQYQIVEHIGRGGMADVWSARDHRLNRMVAVKTIVPGLIGDSDPVALFKHEAQTVAQLEHPHILPIYDFGEFKGKLYIVMRYMAGGTLGDQLQRGALPVNEALKVATAVSQALDFAHARSIIHLDLKPQNVLLDSYQSPYLADFGLAAVLDRDGRAMNPGSGTLMYMAPEQLTAKVIDHRADIYSFAVLLYHLFTGQLPFEGASPLSLRQLQHNEELPEIENFPPYVTDLLRRATSTIPEYRPANTAELLNEIKTVLSDSVDLTFETHMGGLDEHDDLFIGGQVVQTDDADLLEAVDIYSRARYVWSAGQGRFLLGVTHYMIMNGYYKNADKFGLTLDEEGRQMLLRGALEYDIEVDFWWNQMNDANRRWVCLHTIRSANVPARIRALYRLETLPDAEPPRIPRLVAQTLQAETNDQARLAALQVLATRARLMKPLRGFDIKTEYRGRMLTTFTRFEVQVAPDTDWQETIYSPEIDTLLAQVALDVTSPIVAESAARVVGRIRSKTAVRYLAKQQRLQQDGGLRALALVRDEAPDLPDIVSPQVRFYAWLANTWRRLSDEPLALTWRFLFAVIGGWLGMGFHVFNTFTSVAILSPDRIANTIGFGLIFGVLTGITVLLADELPSRLRGFWRRRTRLLFSVILGFGWATYAWGFVWWIFFRQDANQDLMFFAGFALAFGFILSSLLDLRGWLAAPITAFSVYLSIYAAFNNSCQLNYICPQSPGFSAAPAALLGLILGAFAGVVLRISNPQDHKLKVKLPLPSLGQAAAGVGIGTLWVFATWGIYRVLFAAQINGLQFPINTTPDPNYFPLVGIQWVTVVGFVLYGLITGGLIAHALEFLPRFAFFLTALVGFLAMLYVVNPAIVTYNGDPIYQLGFSPIHTDALLTYVANSEIYESSGVFDYTQLFTVGISTAILIAMGGYMMSLNRDFWRLRQQILPPPVPTITPESPDVDRPRTNIRDTALMTSIIDLRETLGTMDDDGGEGITELERPDSSDLG